MDPRLKQDPPPSDTNGKRNFRMPVVVSILLLSLVVLIGFLIARSPSQTDVVAIRARYAQMHQALQASDLSAAQDTIIHWNRRKASFRSLEQLDRLANQPLGSNAVILVARDRAFVIPVPSPQAFHSEALIDRLQFVVFQTSPSGKGHHVEFTNANGEWYFTGNHHID